MAGPSRVEPDGEGRVHSLVGRHVILIPGFGELRRATGFEHLMTEIVPSPDSRSAREQIDRSGEFIPKEDPDDPDPPSRRGRVVPGNIVKRFLLPNLRVPARLTSRRRRPGSIVRRVDLEGSIAPRSRVAVPLPVAIRGRDRTGCRRDFHVLSSSRRRPRIDSVRLPGSLVRL